MKYIVYVFAHSCAQYVWLFYGVMVLQGIKTVSLPSSVLWKNILMIIDV